MTLNKVNLLTKTMNYDLNQGWQHLLIVINIKFCWTNGQWVNRADVQWSLKKDNFIRKCLYIDK